MALRFLVIFLAFAAAACATGFGAARLERQFVDLGFSADRAGCLAGELDERLEDDDMRAVSGFLDGLNQASTPGQSLDALVSIDNPDAAAAIARSALACAF